MHRIRPFFGLIATCLVLLGLTTVAGIAQSTSVRAPVAVNGLSLGFVCDTANGWVVTTDAAGRPQCTQSIANATNATNATNAQNAVSATTAGQAQTLNPNAQVNASQISGVISSNNLPASSGGGSSAPPVNCIGGSSGTQARPGSWWVVVNGYAQTYSAGTTGYLSGNYPTLQAGQSTSFPISGGASDGTFGMTVPVGGTAVASCSAAGSISFSAFNWSGSIDNNPVVYNAGGS